MAGRVGSSIASHHWSETSGSIRVWQRSHVPTAWRYDSRPIELAALAEPGEDPLVRLGLREPGEVAGVLVHAPVGPITVSTGRSWSRPISKSVGSWPGRDLERTGAELRMDALVARSPERGARRTGRRPRGRPRRASARPRGARRRRRRRGSSRGGRWRSDVALALRERIADVRQRVVASHVDELEVREGRLVEGAPVDDPVRPVDPALPGRWTKKCA